jgi:hypothetical protein
MVERFPSPPETVVGLKSKSQEAPGIEVREDGEPRIPDDNAKATDEIMEDPPEAEIDTPTDEATDEFADLLDMPTFEDFETVFSSYPYVMMADHEGWRVLVLGYLSARDRQTDDLILTRGPPQWAVANDSPRSYTRTAEDALQPGRGLPLDLFCLAPMRVVEALEG